MERKRKRVDDETRMKINDLEQRKTEISHMEDKVQKQEKAFVRKSDELKVKEKEIKTQSQLLKEREKSLKVEEKRLELHKKDIVLEKESLEARKVDLDKLMADLSRKQHLNLEESEKLKTAERERVAHLRLQMGLKDEVEKVRQQQELLLKEGETLKQDRLKFEEEWEVLDEKRAAIVQETQKLNREKENFEKVKNDHRQLMHDYEARRRELEIDMQTKLNEMELSMKEREKALEKANEAQCNDINKLKLSAMNEIEEMKSQKQRLQKEKEQIASSKRELEGQQIEMQKDINELFSLSEKVNNQRKLLTEERKQFISFVERLKNCESCGKVVSSYAISDQNLAEAKDIELSQLRDKAINDESHADSRIEDDQEHSEQSKLRRSRRQAAAKSKKSTRSSKRTVIEETTSISAEMSRGHVDSEETKIGDKGKRTRKRNSGQNSQMAGSELQPVDSDHSQSVTTGRRYLKRHKTDVPVPPSPENKRYNLRRKKPVVSVGSDPAERNPNPDPEAASGDANRVPLVQVTTHKRFETEDVSLQRGFKSVSPSAGIDEDPSGANEDRISTPVYNVEDEPDTILHTDDNDDTSDEYDDSDASDGDDDPGEVSVGRKVGRTIWTFFST